MGAISADCHPEDQARKQQAAATMVFPEPTSPWTNRFMGRPERQSSSASRMARRWAAVREKGSRA